MRINELILENQQLDELSFAGGIGKVASGVGQAVGGIKGAYQGVKQQYAQGKQKGQQGAFNAVTGNGQQQPAPAQNTQATTPANGAAPNANTQPTATPAQNTQQANPQDADDGRIEPTLDPEQGQQQAAPAPTATQAPAGNTRARMGAPEGRKAVDQAVATVKQVRGDRRAQVVNYGKQQFDALAGVPTAESRVGYRSRFLDMDI